MSIHGDLLRLTETRPRVHIALTRVPERPRSVSCGFIGAAGAAVLFQHGIYFIYYESKYVLFFTINATDIRSLLVVSGLGSVDDECSFTFWSRCTSSVVAEQEALVLYIVCK